MNEATSNDEMEACKTCGLRFSTLRKLSDHQAEIHGRRPCWKCDKHFKSWKTLSGHQRDVHLRKMLTDGGVVSWAYSEQPTETCDLCDGKFFTRKARVTHKRRFHKKPYHCAECDFKTGTAAELKRHAGKHDSNAAAAAAEPPKKRAKTDATSQEATSSAAPDRLAKGPPKKRAETDAASQEATSTAAADATEQVQQQQNNHMLRYIHT
ncbi:MAG: hypothetical protein GY833_10735 [Aestuariibacter sp.]|nr:hypothetical protein [Aestuariibacter sp.]